MNPDSMFADYRSGKRASNASARLLSVKDDMEPVISYLMSKVSKGDVVKVSVCLTYVHTTLAPKILMGVPYHVCVFLC